MLLPGDFKKDSAATLRITFFNPQVDCSMRFGVDHVERYRVGAPAVQGPPGTMGVQGGGTTDVAVPPTTTFVKTCGIKGLTTGALKGQRAGDAITVAFERDGSYALDTCGGIFVMGAELRYTVP